MVQKLQNSIWKSVEPKIAGYGILSHVARELLLGGILLNLSAILLSEKSKNNGRDIKRFQSIIKTIEYIKTSQQSDYISYDLTR